MSSTRLLNLQNQITNLLHNLNFHTEVRTKLEHRCRYYPTMIKLSNMVLPFRNENTLPKQDNPAIFIIWIEDFYKAYLHTQITSKQFTHFIKRICKYIQEVYAEELTAEQYQKLKTLTRAKLSIESDEETEVQVSDEESPAAALPPIAHSAQPSATNPDRTAYSATMFKSKPEHTLKETSQNIPEKNDASAYILAKSTVSDTDPDSIFFNPK